MPNVSAPLNTSVIYPIPACRASEARRRADAPAVAGSHRPHSVIGRLLCVLVLLSTTGQRSIAQDTPATTQPTKPMTVGRNATHRDTAEIQRFLKVAATGKYDLAATAAVIAFQTANGLTADGIWGADSDGIAFKRAACLKSAATAVTTSNGTKVDGRKIGGINVHHTATTADQRAYFAGRNARLSCPTIYIKTDGSIIEFIRPGVQPWSTGSADRDRLAVEIQNESGAPDWRISDKAGDALVDVLVELATTKVLDGCAVEFTLDRAHVGVHREFHATACPGPYVMSKLDDYIARAVARVKK